MATKTLLTADQFAQLPDDGNHMELDRGELVSMPPPKPRHNRIAKRIFLELVRAAEDSKSGEVFTEMAFRLGADTVRVPDVSLVGAGQARTIQPDEYVEGAPLLAVEVVSPSETAEDLEQKVGQYLGAGSKLVWVVYPKSAKVYVYSANRGREVLKGDDELVVPDAVPAASFPVSRLFE